MALEFKTSSAESSDSTQISILDTTLAYNATTNTGGFGTPNPDIGDIVASETIVTKPDTTTLIPSTDPTYAITFDTYYGSVDGYLPNITGATQPILSTDLGYDEFLLDGIYKIATTITDDLTDPAGTYLSEEYIIVDNTVRCCIENLLLSINLDNCGDCLTSDSTASQAALGFLYLDGAHTAINQDTPDINKAAAFILKAQLICQNCGGCAC